MKASVKYRVINRFKDKYNVRDMCIFFGVSHSGYYAWTKKMDKADPDKQIGELIRDCQKKTRQTYGYRRVQIWLLREFGLVMNHKAVLRVMNKYNLLSKSSGLLVGRPRFRGAILRLFTSGLLPHHDFAEYALILNLRAMLS